MLNETQVGEVVYASRIWFNTPLLPCSKVAKLPCKLHRTSLAVYVEIFFFFFEHQRETISGMNYSSVLTSRAVYTFLDD